MAVSNMTHSCNKEFHTSSHDGFTLKYASKNKSFILRKKYENFLF